VQAFILQNALSKFLSSPFFKPKLAYFAIIIIVH
jgi:hypothetical protein